MWSACRRISTWSRRSSQASTQGKSAHNSDADLDALETQGDDKDEVLLLTSPVTPPVPKENNKRKYDELYTSDELSTSSDDTCSQASTVQGSPASGGLTGVHYVARVPVPCGQARGAT